MESEDQSSTLFTVSFSTNEQGSSFVTVTDENSQDAVVEPILSSELSGLKVEAMRTRCRGDSELCRSVLDGLDKKDIGFCQVATLKPSKEGGYVQLSYDGANKFAVLQEVLLWAKGVTLNVKEGYQCSHLCGNPLCTLPEHVTAESAQKNNARKGCVVWWPCPHCQLKILICRHDPVCIKFVPGFESWAAFLENGIHLAPCYECLSRILICEINESVYVGA